ncbi:MAG: gamma-glutamylcyclotransferase family protein [Flavisolibacter sp.]
MENLFSYGTLQLEKVQLETFGRSLQGVPDRLMAYKIETIKIKVESVVNLSGTEEHTIITYTGNNSDVVEGVVLSITPGELVHADEYETEDYKRIQVTLQSGKRAWVYVKHDSK